MPAQIGWSAKFIPDPKHPGYSIAVGSYAHDFIQWAKLFGKPTWHPIHRDQCVLGRPIWLQEPIFETKENPDEPGAMESILVQKGITVEMFWPLPLLERIFEKMQKWDPVGLIDIHTNEPTVRGCI